MTQCQLRKLFLRHYGESSRLARELGLSRTTVSRWFRGHVSSRRLETAIRSRARQLIENEGRVETAAALSRLAGK